MNADITIIMIRASNLLNNNKKKPSNTKNKTKNEFIIRDIDWSKWVPKFKIVNTKELPNGNMVYYMRSNSARTLFINALYWSFHNFQLNLGYEPESPFLYAQFNPQRIIQTTESIFKEKVYDRLIMYEKKYKYDGINRKFLFVCARFFSNEIDKDFGFYVRCGARSVTLFVFKNTKLLDKDGNEMPANEFFYDLLMTMKYPLYVYQYNLNHGTLRRMFYNYDDVCDNKGKYKKWRF
jgi:hypothetical protein